MKLNELIAAHKGASNRLINLEHLTEDDILKIYKRYQRLAIKAAEEDNKTTSHSVEEIDDD